MIERLQPPPEVVEIVAATTGAPALSWDHVVAGHTHAEKWRVQLVDGRSVFVKAAEEQTARSQIEREHALLESLGAPFMPTVHGGESGGAWSVLVLEDLTGAHWPPPYVDGGVALLEAVARIGGVPPPAALSRRPEGRPFGTYWQRIADDPEPVLAQGSFSRAWLQQTWRELDAAESRALLAGDDFIHDDVWHGNVCYTARGVVLIDWASATIGDRRLDLAYALLSIRASEATPPPVAFDDEAAYAALIAGANAHNAAQPVDESISRASILREGWLHDLRYALVWATGLLGLPRPDEVP
jgi:aminoglycoside phosphotransferase